MKPRHPVIVALRTSCALDGQTETVRVLEFRGATVTDVTGRLCPGRPLERREGKAPGALGVRLPTASAPAILKRFAGNAPIHWR